MQIDHSHETIRPVMIERGFLHHPNGSAIISMGSTRVLCAATVTDELPDFRKESRVGWITAEYTMLPGATAPRKNRESAGSRPDKRNIEISRFLGRCLRSAVDLELLGPHTIKIDCDVLDADGGTRAAALTGSLVALYDALLSLHRSRNLPGPWPLKDFIAGVSVVLINRVPILDPTYEQDRVADMELNLAVTSGGELIEVHGMAEGESYKRETLDSMIEMGIAASRALFTVQKRVLGVEPPGDPTP